MRHGLGQNELYPALATVPEAQTLTSWTTERCVDYLRYRRDPSLPFFLWCSYSKPHRPSTARTVFQHVSRGGDRAASHRRLGIRNGLPTVVADTRAGMNSDLLSRRRSLRRRPPMPA